MNVGYLSLDPPANCDRSFHTDFWLGSIPLAIAGAGALPPASAAAFGDLSLLGVLDRLAAPMLLPDPGTRPAVGSTVIVTQGPTGRLPARPGSCAAAAQPNWTRPSSAMRRSTPRFNGE
jgi:hypothetical protein